MLTLGMAAKAAGKSKTTIAKAIKDGKVSAGRNDDGSYAIDPAELFRVYPPVSESDRTAGRDETVLESEVSTAALQAQIAGLEAQLDLMRERVADLKDERDQWQGQAQRAQEALMDMRPTKPWWTRLGKAG